MLAASMKRILFIRGGGLGDFIVTLPTLRLLREKWPAAHIENLGHPRIAELALRRRYLDGVRSVNHGPLSAFFMPRAVLEPEWMDYVGTFDLVLSYFYDPDGLFRTNLERCHPGQIITHPPRVPENFGAPAALHFAEILRPLGLGLALGDDAASDVFPCPADLDAANAFLSGLASGTRLVAIHPGSGGEKKNWPESSWAELGRRLVEAIPEIALLLIEGEADPGPAQALAEAWKGLPLLRARLLPLPILAALLRRATLFLGHDSGVTHLAAAARRDLPVIALFGPTDPQIWAPPRPGVEVIRDESGRLDAISVERVLEAARKRLSLQQNP
jgi:heptosyltransferase-2